jgi:hypothetical protein
MKRALIVLVVMGFTASLGAQSLVELAKREKERRESFGGRHAVVVKNRDLLQVKKIPAVEVTNPGVLAGDSSQAADRDAIKTDVSGDAGLATPPAGSKAASGRPITGENAAEDITEGGGPLEDQLKVVDALVEELTTELNSLRQQYEAQNSMVPGSVIQQQMEETYLRLTRSEARQAKIREKMGAKAPAIKKDSGSADQ